MSVSRRELLGLLGAAGLFGTAIGAAGPALAATSAAPGVIVPPRLRAGMTVGLVATASPVWEDEDARAAIELLESLGFRVRPGAQIFERDAYLAGSDAARAEDFNAIARDPEVDAIVCLRGGYGTARILPAIDYDAIAAKPRVIMGYSDVTALLNAVHRRTGLLTFHGPIAAQNFSEYTYAEYRKVLVDGAGPAVIGAAPPLEARPGVVERENRLTPIVGGRAEGRLVGGNLTLLAHLVGTPYEPDYDGAILFLEDVYEAPYSIDRMLTHLWLAGRLQRCAGIALGKFTEAEVTGNTFSVERVLRDRFEGLGIPTLRGLMIGHVDDQTVVPVGARARLDVDAGTLTLLEPAVS